MDCRVTLSRSFIRSFSTRAISVDLPEFKIHRIRIFAPLYRRHGCHAHQDRGDGGGVHSHRQGDDHDASHGD